MLQYGNTQVLAKLLSCSRLVRLHPSTKSSIQASVAFLALMHCNTQRLRRGRDASRRGPQVQEFGFQLLCHQIVARVHQNLCKFSGGLKHRRSLIWRCIPRLPKLRDGMHVHVIKWHWRPFHVDSKDFIINVESTRSTWLDVTNCCKIFGWCQCHCPAKSGWHKLQDSLVATPVMGRSGSTLTAWKRGIVGPNKQIRHVSSMTPSLPRPAPKLPRREELAIHDWAQACATLSHPKRHILDGSQLCCEAGTSWIILVKNLTAGTHTKGERQSSNCKASEINHSETRCLCKTEKKGDIIVKSKMQVHSFSVWPKTKMYKQTFDIQPWLVRSAHALWGRPFERFFRPKHWWSSSTGDCSPVALTQRRGVWYCLTSSA